MGAKTGLDAVLKYKTGGISGGGSWIILTNCKDVTLNLEKSEADASSRASRWKRIKAGMKDASIEWEMVWDTNDAGFTAIKNAYFDDAIIGLQALDGGEDGESGEGLQADFEVLNFTRNEPLGDAITVSVSVKIAYSNDPPSWIGGS